MKRRKNIPPPRPILGPAAKPPPRRAPHPEVMGLILLSLSFLSLLCLTSFEMGNLKAHWLGLIGYGIALGLNYLFGFGSFILVTYIGYLGIKMISQGVLGNLKSKHLYFSIFLFSCCILLNLIAEAKLWIPPTLLEKLIVETLALPFPYPHRITRINFGGVPFYYLLCDLPVLNLKHLLSLTGVGITFSVTAFVSFLLGSEIKPTLFYSRVKQKIVALYDFLFSEKKQPDVEEKPVIDISLSAPKSLFTAPKQSIPPLSLTKKPLPLTKPVVESKSIALSSSKSEPMPKKTTPPAPLLHIDVEKKSSPSLGNYTLPSPSLLRNPTKADLSSLKKDLRRQAELLEETLLSFGIEAKVGEIQCGPTITSFEVHPAVGVKVQKIKALEDDIALNLQAKSIRIIAPIPGKAVVGVEIPSLVPQEVSFKELLLFYQEQTKKAHIPLLLGKTVRGEIVVSDLAKMPHCIIAGATGSGKSVCINTLVMSIVMNATPEEIRLLMIDPKKVELTGYTRLPHMIAPVITEPHGAYAALNWLVKEMQLRYEILKQLGLRNIVSFNERKRDLALEESLGIPIPASMPKFVAIIDEFADLMMASSTDLETPIARIAQMARAVGIHLVLATQRPSREVITGLIKANFPTRIAFKVASRINSQIILDDTGAETLLGNGDMLFLPPGSSHLIRAQGSYISDEEINSVVNYLCKQQSPQYLISSFDKLDSHELNIGYGEEGEGRDTLYEQALKIVIETGNASTTFLQRKLKIGYARAASLMDELEMKGIVSPSEGAKPRRVLNSSSPRKDFSDS